MLPVPSALTPCGPAVVLVSTCTFSASRVLAVWLCCSTDAFAGPASAVAQSAFRSPTALSNVEMQFGKKATKKAKKKAKPKAAAAEKESLIVHEGINGFVGDSCSFLERGGL